MWIMPDSFPYKTESSYRTWFAFQVTGFPQGIKSLSFTIKNMSN